MARIVRPWGRRGEVRAAVLTDFPERLVKLGDVLLGGANRVPRHARVRSCRLEPSGRFAIFHFEGSDSIGDAERLVGLDVQIPVSERAPLPDGSYYVDDLVGCEVRETAGRVLGRVREVEPTGEAARGTPVLVVETASGELLVPLAAEICREIDLASRRILVRLPEGLGELNRE